MGHRKFISTMQQTNLCGITFPLSKQSLYKLISTLKGSHFCGENFTEKGTTRWQFTPLPPKRGILERGYVAPSKSKHTYSKYCCAISAVSFLSIQMYLKKFSSVLCPVNVITNLAFLHFRYKLVANERLAV